MYYRVAIQVDAGPTWQWKSTVISSLESLFRFLRLYSALPQHRLLVFLTRRLTRATRAGEPGASIQGGEGCTLSP
jgi:hypothetical protein